jgi:hypothetical protein
MTVAIRVERHVPLPPKKIPHRMRFPLEDLGRGDSFFVPAADRQQRVLEKNRVFQSVRQMRKRMRLSISEYQVTIRYVPGGLRCWRIV